MKYLVMECHLSYAVVLDESGRFLRVANRNYQVGQTVTDVIPMEAPPAKKPIPWTRSLSALAACLMVVLGLFLFRSPYASVYLTINPQVRVDVNRSDMVLKVEGVNDDGITLVEGYDYRRKDLDTVMDELVDRAIDMGFLHEGGTIQLTLDADDEWVVSHESHLQEQISRHVSDRITIVIDIDSPSAPQGTIQIPVGGETGYSDTDYGPDHETTPHKQNHHNGDTDYGDTDYDG